MDEGSDSQGLEAPSARTQAVVVIDEQPRPVDAARLRTLAGHVLTACEVPEWVELCVRLVDRDTMTRLNEQYLGGSGPTDVLAFPLDVPGQATEGPPVLLGDVAISPEVAADQAAERGVEPADEMELLAVHGVLHLLGYDHAEADERARMFALTDRLLAEFRRSVS